MSSLPGQTAVTESDLCAGLRELGLDQQSTVVVHSSLRSFGRVEGGAVTVCRALAAICGTVMMPAATWDLTGLPAAPPGLVRPNNAYPNAGSWEDFDASVEQAHSYSPNLPIDRELGIIPEAFRTELAPLRSIHPMMSYIAAGPHAQPLLDRQRLDWPLGPFDALAELNGQVLLLGTDHNANTAIHLAEQQLGRSLFWRYARFGNGTWIELPNIPGESGGFSAIEPLLASSTREEMIGNCRARCIPVRDVIAAATSLIEDNPGALLLPSDDPASRYWAALQQRLAYLAANRPGQVLAL